MSSEFSSALRGELLDEFYSECDELITSVRNQLLELESSVSSIGSSPKQVEPLYRHLHTLKGICAIAGVRSAEELAHAMEDLLRNVTRASVVLTLDDLDLLGLAIQRLNQIVGAHRQSAPAPDITDLMARLQDRAAPDRTVTPETKSAARLPEESKYKAAGSDSAAPTVVATFSPSAALDQRGVNVGSIRARLKAIGDIVKATPSVRPGGSIVFEFLIATSELPAALTEWENDGVQFTSPPSHPKSAELEPTTAADPTTTNSLSLSPSHIVRVDLARLDDLMRITGEMVIHRSRLEERMNHAGQNSGKLKEVYVALARSLREMRQAVARVRMVPMGEIFSRMPFTVRDLARQSNKKANVTLEGDQTELDKYLVERLKEPLLHLVRNAFAHGVETTAERVAAGKPAEATIALSARSEANFVSIRIRDDGRGIDFGAVASRASFLGVPVPESLDGASVLKILCSPGFSTRDRADLASGRGVGMAVVANTVRELGGTLRLDTKLGHGTEFTLRLPVTLSIADALIVVVGDQQCAVPQSAVDEIAQIPATEVRTIQRTLVAAHRGALLPLVTLRSLFHLPPSSDSTLTLLVCTGERGAVGLVVDRVTGQREIVIRSLSDPLVKVPEVSGATELGDGRPILILDPIAITQAVVRPRDADVTKTSGHPAPSGS